jgi:MinD superfamily P-loop ATPase
MKIAVASGKGGTGKTTVSSSLISVWDEPVIAVDMDVEEPNLNLFLNIPISTTETANLEIPQVVESVCSKCGKCAEICQFKAISLMGTVLLTFPEMCHGCGGCMAICPENAIIKGSRELGEICQGSSGPVELIMGRIRVGEAMSPPLMRELKKSLTGRIEAEPRDIVIDAPPGVSCPAVNAVMDSDIIILVTEPTPFGLYDMKLAHQAFSPLGKHMGVVINRSGLGTSEVYGYCRSEDLEILAEIPYKRSIAEMYAKGLIVSDHSEEIRDIFLSLARRLRQIETDNSSIEVAHA